MDYTISDMHGFALIEQTASETTVVAVPLPLGDGFFAFAKLMTFDTRADAQALVAAIITAGGTPADYVNDDREEEDNSEQRDTHLLADTAAAADGPA